MSTDWAAINEGRNHFADAYLGDDPPIFANPSSKYYGGTLSKNPNWRPTVDDPVPRGQCEYIKRTGDRCRHSAIPGLGNDPTDKMMCIYHGGRLPNVQAKAERVRAAAADTLLDLVQNAVDHLSNTMDNTAAPDAVRLKAATEILDRAGIKQADTLSVTVEHKQSPVEILAQQFAALRADDPEELEEADETPDEPERDPQA